MTDVRTIELGESRRDMLVSEPSWFVTYFAAVLLGIAILVCCIAFISGGITGGWARTATLVAPVVLVLVGLWCAMSPRYFFTRKTLGLIVAKRPDEYAFRLGMLPANVATLKALSSDLRLEIDLSRRRHGTYATLGDEAMELWSLDGDRLARYARLPRAELTVVNAIYGRGMRLVVQFGSNESMRLALTPSLGIMRTSVADTTAAMIVISRWLKHDDRDGA